MAKRELTAEELEAKRRAEEFERRYGKAYDPTAPEEKGIEPSIIPLNEEESKQAAEIAAGVATGAGAGAALTKGGIRGLIMQAAKQEGKRELTAPMKKAIEKKLLDKKMEELATAKERPFREEMGERVLEYAKIGKESQSQVNQQLAKKVPTAESITYKRTQGGESQDYFAGPLVKKRSLVGDAMEKPPLPTPKLPLPGDGNIDENKDASEVVPTAPNVKGRIRKRARLDEDESMVPPQEIAGAY